ncbi:MAG: substrate-binding domain-containing protein [Ruminococcus sp.]|nr:substrate-binding domain-containing protein [Ruminococcus sp.]
MKKRLLIGVIVAECQINFQIEILKGIISQAFKTNCNIVILAPLHNFYVNNTHKQAEKEIFKLIKSRRFDGFLYDRNTFYDEGVKTYIDNLLIATGKPVMLLDSQEHKLFESTAIDDCTAFEQITDHLIDVHGYKKIYCLTGPKKFFVSEERMRGFVTSMKNHGLSFRKERCLYGDFWKNAAEELAAKIIRGDIDRPEAVVCGNDISAIALTEALIRGGISVPEDIAVTGYDASEEGKSNIPRIASYRRPNFQLGAEAFRRIYRLITGKICRKVRDEMGNFCPAQSCGCDNPPLQALSRQDRMLRAYEDDILHRDMLFDITNTSNPEDFADRLDNYTYYIHKMKHMNICLTKKYIDCKNGKLTDSLTFETGDEMKVVLSKDGAFRRFDNITFFSSEDILPDYNEELPYPLAYFITPLHFNDNFFGYSSISFGKLPMSFSELYLHWINYINVALEQVRIKSILDKTIIKASHAMHYDNNTGLLNRTGVKKEFSKRISELRKKSDNVEFIRIQLSGLNDAQYQGDDDKCSRITSAFAGFIRECIKEDEICGIWSVYSFAIITTRKNRSEEIYAHLSEKVKHSRFSENNNCNINFTIGTDIQPLFAEISPGTCLHKAALNRIYSYTVTESAENPQYEKLCLLRGRIMKNPELPWNVNDIASELYLSKSYLQKMYKQYFGKSIIMDMIECRLEKAKELLTSSDMTVTDVSKECGYSSYNYFVRQFKAAEGMSPSEYRENK